MVRNYINGEWSLSQSSSSVDIINPADERVLDQCPLGTCDDVDRAVKAAEAAFWHWRQVPVLDRVQYLFKLKSLLEENFESLSNICTLEHGKTLDESRGDVRRGIQMIDTAIGMPSLMMGQCLENVAGGIDCRSVRQPLGVFAAITPFNFPVMVPFWFWPFAVSSGNTFILKPSERVPLSQIKVFELIEKVGLPRGVLNLVHGGKEVVDALCAHPDIKGISFVGSTPVARHVYENASRNGKRVQALGGAKNFMVVMPDAKLEPSVKTILESILGCAGQRCLAGSVVVAVGDVHDNLQERIVNGASDINVGDGRGFHTTMGPLISRAAVDRVTKLIQSAINEGATLLLDGRSTSNQRGYYLKPTVLGNVTKSMLIAREEVFGPVVCLAQANTLDDAVTWINSSSYANTASLFTSSGAAMMEFCHKADPGMLGINIGVPAPMSFFGFGGRKESFFGDIKAHGSQCIQFFTDTKVIIERWY